MTVAIIVLCNMMLCSSVDAYQDFSTPKIQAEDSSTIFVSIYQTTKHHFPEDHSSIHSNSLFICMLNSTARGQFQSQHERKENNRKKHKNRTRTNKKKAISFEAM